MSRLSAKLRAAVLDRDGHRCVRCGIALDQAWTYSIHHRTPRGMGGSKRANTMPNLITLCGSGVTLCHGWIESHRDAARDLGYLVRRGHDPATTPVLIAGRGLVLLDDRGCVTPMNRSAA